MRAGVCAGVHRYGVAQLTLEACVLAEGTEEDEIDGEELGGASPSAGKKRTASSPLLRGCLCR